MHLSSTDQFSPAENNFTANIQNLNSSAPEVSVKPSQKDIPLETADIKINPSPVTFKNIDNYFFDVTSRLRSILNTEAVQPSRGGAAFFV